MLNAVDGCIPPDLATGTAAEIEEERRLLYVARTRAKDSLRLVTPQRFFTHGQPAQGDRHVYTARTRFIPAATLGFFECVSWPVAVAAGERLAGGGLRVDVRAKMRGMWGVSDGRGRDEDVYSEERCLRDLWWRSSPIALRSFENERR